MNITVLIAEDDANIINLVRLYLEREGIKVVAASSGAEALQLFKTINPDLVILDIMMPAPNGWEVLKEIRKTSNTPTILLTARDDELDKILGLEIGADDYVTKPFSPRELVARVKSLWRRTLVSAASTNKLVFPGLVIDCERREVLCADKKVKLTPKEYELLGVMADAYGRPMTREMLLERVWGYDFPGDDRTVDVHIKRLRQKLQHDKYSYLHTVWGVGYKFEVKDSAEE